MDSECGAAFIFTLKNVLLFQRLNSGFCRSSKVCSMFSSPMLRQGVAFAVILPLVSAYTCYWPDGSNATSSGYVACNSTAAASSCCDPNAACTTFGWCLGASGAAYRGACTQQDWNTPACMASYCQSNCSHDASFGEILTQRRCKGQLSVSDELQ